jgi:hypothetical protein
VRAKAADVPFSLGEKVDAPKARPDEGPLKTVPAMNIHSPALTPDPSPRGRGEEEAGECVDA